MKQKMINQTAYNPLARGKFFTQIKQKDSDRLKNLAKLMERKACKQKK